eukprot:m.194962 g.194962  ORF g.194962 m.194962 type:complete len:498 (+) comp19348_c0_seq1:94-1587(+)
MGGDTKGKVHAAVRTGNVHEVETAVSKYGVNEIDPKTGQTPLGLAFELCESEATADVVEFLLDVGGTLPNNESPLRCASAALMAASPQARKPLKRIIREVLRGAPPRLLPPKAAIHKPPTAPPAPMPELLKLRKKKLDIRREAKASKARVKQEQESLRVAEQTALTATLSKLEVPGGSSDDVTSISLSLTPILRRRDVDGATSAVAQAATAAMAKSRQTQEADAARRRTEKQRDKQREREAASLAAANAAAAAQRRQTPAPASDDEDEFLSAESGSESESPPNASHGSAHRHQSHRDANKSGSGSGAGSTARGIPREASRPPAASATQNRQVPTPSVAAAATTATTATAAASKAVPPPSQTALSQTGPAVVAERTHGKSGGGDSATVPSNQKQSSSASSPPPTATARTQRQAPVHLPDNLGVKEVELPPRPASAPPWEMGQVASAQSPRKPQTPRRTDRTPLLSEDGTSGLDGEVDEGGAAVSPKEEKGCCSSCTLL